MKCVLSLFAICAVLFCAAESLRGDAKQQQAGAAVGWAHDDGQVLLGELNCAACHDAGKASASLLNKQSPILNDVGSRITPQYLRAFLSSPHHAKQGTPMPDVLHGMGQRERDQAVETLVHFLVSLGGPMEQRSGASEFQIERGKELYHTVGCVACHQAFEPPPKLETGDAAQSVLPQDDEDKPKQKRRSPTIGLGDLAMKTTVDRLAEFLEDPLHVRPAGRMPSLGLDRGEANLVAAYLLRDQLSKNETGWGVGLDWAYYSGNFPRVPEFDKLKPVAEGQCKSIDLAAVEQGIGKKLGGNFAVRFFGMLTVPADGQYRFWTKSDDGSLLWIDGKKVVDNDGHHPPGEKEGTIELKRGRYPFEVGMMQGGGGFELSAHWQPPGAKGREPIPAGLLMHRSFAMIPKGAVAFQLDEQLAAEGKKLFTSVGCANCHQVGKNDDRLASTLSARPLLELNAAAEDGCLGEKVAEGRPHFNLSAPQRAALKSAQGELKKSASPLPPADLAALTMKSLSCYACHTRGEMGGPDAKRSAYFTTLVPADLGDEGRLPPSLSGVGAKLSDIGLAAYLLHGQKSREYMATRMPTFGEENTRHLAKALKAADAGSVPQHQPAISSRLIDDGRRLAGKKALGCVNCHAWGGKKLPGAPGMEMIGMTKRLDAAWFHAFMKDPQQLRPGTRMPTAWPDGKSFFPEIQGGDVEKQIDAIWAYLSVGERGGMPDGLAPEDGYLLVPSEEPIVFRTFLKGVGAHAIAVGFRQRTHMTFDALRVRSAFAWTGDFLSAEPAWSGRAGQYADIPDDNKLAFPAGSPFAVLESPEQPWPQVDMKIKAAPEGWQFDGYRFGAQRVPTFLYRFGDVQIEETPSTSYLQDGSYLKRRFQLTSSKPVKNLWHRIAVGKNISANKDGSFTVDERITYRLKTAMPAKAVVRSSGEPSLQELLLPVEFAPGKQGRGQQAMIEIELLW